MIKTIEQKVLKYILENNLIETGDKVLIALSGGADSVFLFSFLNKYRRRLKINIACFHLNHNLRGSEGKHDEDFCRQLAVDNDCKLFVLSKNIKLYAKRNGISIEEAGREIRYKELKRCLKENEYTRLATAHHGDDNTETVLLNIIKGTGLKGLTGIPVIRENIIRPLLCLSKNEILKYLDRKKISYCTDRSNLENDFQRNYLRNKIIPLIKNKLNPQFDTAVFRMTGVIKDLSHFVDSEVRKAINSASGYKKNQLKIKLRVFTELHPALQGELLKEIVNQFFQIELEHHNIIDLIKLTKKQSGKKINLSGKLLAVKERDYLLFSKNRSSKKNIDYVYLKPGQSKQFGEHTFSVSEVKRSSVNFDLSANREYISSDNIKGSLLVRKWRNGDRFYPLGMKNAKKVSDFLNEQKIESYRKKEHLVLINSENIVWVVGLRIDDRYKITNKTKKVLELCLN
jgi:tRNA(Ile)-lysidine synthase